MKQVFMNEFFSHIRNDRILLYSFSSTLTFLLITLVYSFFFLRFLPPLIPLFNQMPWGEARIGNTWQLFIPAGIVFVVLITNSFLALYLYSKIPLLSRIVSATGLLIAFLALLFIVRTVGLVL